MRIRGLTVLVATAAIAVAACSSSSGSAAPSLPTSVGNGEGALTVTLRPSDGGEEMSVEVDEVLLAARELLSAQTRQRSE